MLNTSTLVMAEYEYKVHCSKLSMSTSTFPRVKTGGCILLKGAIRIQMQMYRVCIEIWVKMHLNLKYFSKHIL